MPYDRWAGQPAPIARRAGGYDITVAAGRLASEEEEWWEGIRIHVPALTATDITAAASADPDATEAHQAEALAIALDCVAPGVQAQIDGLIDALLEV